MKKRLLKKFGNRYNLIKRAEREKSKRRGYKCIEYALVPIGSNDRLDLQQEGYIIEYPYVTHWFVKLEYAKDIFPIKNIEDGFHYIITVYLCTKRGGTNSRFAVNINFFEATSLDNIILVFKRILDNMKNDCFWEKLYD